MLITRTLARARNPRQRPTVPSVHLGPQLAGVLDGTVDAEDDWHMVLVDGEPRVGVQLAPNHVAPDWPDGTPPQQIHLDLRVEDLGSTHDRVTSLGAKVLKPAEDVGSSDNFQVYADPAGHAFCLCWVQRGDLP
jgi:hypothetical protein